MNRRDAIAASFGLLLGGAGAWKSSRIGSPTRRKTDFDPFMVWRESARFDREVLGPMQDRLARAMCESIDRQWRQFA